MSAMLASQVLSLLASLTFANPQPLSSDRPSDDQIRKGLIGSWIVAPDGSAPMNALEVFRPDGTYTFFVYQDGTCKTVMRQIDVKWYVQNGTLVTILGDQKTLQDEVLKIDDAKMTLHSLDDKTVSDRLRSDSCAAPASLTSR